MVGKTEIIVSDDITMDGLSKCKVSPCGVCSMKIKANSVLCTCTLVYFVVYCGKWIHGRCAGVKKVTAKFSRHFVGRKCEGNTGELCYDMKAVCEFEYLVDMVSAGGGCEAAVTARTRCGFSLGVAVWHEASSKAEIGCLQVPCKACNFA